MHKSIWEDTSKISKHNDLNKETKTSVLIIGGGICGILCSYFLKKSGIDSIVVEAKQVASGTTKNTTAKATAQHGLIYSELVKKKGADDARLYFKAHSEAIAEYEKLCKTFDCDFEKKPSYVYSRDDIRKIEAEMTALERIGVNAHFTTEIELPFRISGAVSLKNQAQFNPLKFISRLCQDLDIYENTFVQELLPGRAITNRFDIKFDAAIVATHFPFINKHGGYFLKLYQERAYVSAFENAAKLKGMYLDDDMNGFSFRSYNDTLIIGGSNHRTGKESPAWKPINSFARENYPYAKPKYQWAAQDCMSLDGIAYIGQYSKQTPNLFLATGFNKWGMTSSMLSARILTDLINGRENEYSKLFSPQRSVFKPQLAINAFEATANLITPTKKRCPHLGCALKWNKSEHTWDCPCHGSRFEKDGKLIDNPATRDLS